MTITITRTKTTQEHHQDHGRTKTRTSHHHQHSSTDSEQYSAVQCAAVECSTGHQHPVTGQHSTAHRSSRTSQGSTGRAANPSRCSHPRVESRFHPGLPT